MKRYKLLKELKPFPVGFEFEWVYGGELKNPEYFEEIKEPKEEPESQEGEEDCACGELHIDPDKLFPPQEKKGHEHHPLQYCESCDLMGTATRPLFPQKKEECKAKCNNNGCNCDHAGGCCHSRVFTFKPQPKQKPSEWIAKRREELKAENMGVVQAIIDFLDEHFDK